MQVQALHRQRGQEHRRSAAHRRRGTRQRAASERRAAAGRPFGTKGARAAAGSSRWAAGSLLQCDCERAGGRAKMLRSARLRCASMHRCAGDLGNTGARALLGRAVGRWRRARAGGREAAAAQRARRVTGASGWARGEAARAQTQCSLVAECVCGGEAPTLVVCDEDAETGGAAEGARRVGGRRSGGVQAAAARCRRQARAQARRRRGMTARRRAAEQGGGGWSVGALLLDAASMRVATRWREMVRLGDERGRMDRLAPWAGSMRYAADTRARGSTGRVLRARGESNTRCLPPCRRAAGLQHSGKREQLRCADHRIDKAPSLPDEHACRCSCCARVWLPLGPLPRARRVALPCKYRQTRPRAVHGTGPPPWGASSSQPLRRRPHACAAAFQVGARPSLSRAALVPPSSLHMPR